MANHFREYFNFSKKERIGIITLLLLVAVVWLLPSFFTYNANINTEAANVFKQEVAAYKAAQLAQSKSTGNTDSAATQNNVSANGGAKSVSLFYFDPNLISEAGWQQLGLPNRTIRIIQKYIAKGGRFYKASDLERIYGLTKEDYTRLLPYVKIAGKENKLLEKNALQPVNAHRDHGQRAYELTDVNTADTAAFIKLAGIGSKLAARIVNFRDKLGGFYAVEQLAEVYGIHDTVFYKIKKQLACTNPEVRKLDINSASFDMLKAHPYIKYQVANAVIQYRKQHGNFKSLDQLKDIHLLSQAAFLKLKPYISVH